MLKNLDHNRALYRRARVAQSLRVEPFNYRYILSVYTSMLYFYGDNVIGGINVCLVT